MVGVTWVNPEVLTPKGLVGCSLLLLDAHAESIIARAINILNMNFLDIYTSSIS